ncbi:phosphatidic acid phosphatase type 2/haloperoxidase [Pavlovales sp. CCMP2436]|nr:phosphatidic acid phosphatase type 2/haloperoxidase [Pavlovales sp. CCMP2436]
MGGVTRPLLSSVFAPAMQAASHGVDVAAVQAVDDSVRTFAAQHFASAFGFESLPGLVLSSLPGAVLVASVGVSAAWISSVTDQQREQAVRCVTTLFSLHTLLLIPLVEFVIKPVVHRLRPDTLHHHSFSFPSGHTSSATFISGALFLVLLPRLLAALAAARPGNVQLAPPPRPVLFALWMATSLGTALGRILSDAHWFSDTVIGALLGALLLLPLIVSLPPDEPLPAASEEEADPLLAVASAVPPGEALAALAVPEEAASQ